MFCLVQENIVRHLYICEKRPKMEKMAWKPKITSVNMVTKNTVYWPRDTLNENCCHLEYWSFYLLSCFLRFNLEGKQLLTKKYIFYIIAISFALKTTLQLYKKMPFLLISCIRTMGRQV